METTTKAPVTERIKTFEDAQRETGRPDVPDFSNLPEDLRVYFENQYKAIVITEALNEGWKAKWEDCKERKWYPCFLVSPSGFVFYDSDYCYSLALAGCAVRLCFKSAKLATYAGKQFTEIYQNIILK